MADLSKTPEKPPAEQKQENEEQTAESLDQVSQRETHNETQKETQGETQEDVSPENFFNQAQVKEKETLSEYNQTEDVQTAAAKGHVGTSTPPVDVSFVDRNHKSVIDNFKDKPTLCVYHKQKEVSLFCRTCGRLICSLCIVLGSHGNHKLCEADDTRWEIESELIKMIQNKNKELAEKLKNKEREIKIQKDCVQESCNKVAKEINQHMAKVQFELEKWSQNLQTLVTDHQRRQIQSLEEQQFQSETCLSFLETFQTNPSVVEILSGTKMIQILEILQNTMETSKQTNPDEDKGEIPLTFVSGIRVTEDNSHMWFGSLIGLDNNSSVSMATKNMSENLEVISTEKALSDEDDFEDAVGSCTKYEFGDAPIDRIAPVDATKVFIVTQKKLYLLDLSKAHTKGYLKQTKPLMTNVIHITPVTKCGIYVQQLESTLIQRVTTTGQVYRFVDLKFSYCNLNYIGITHSEEIILCMHHEAKNRLGQFEVQQEFHKYNNAGIKTCCLFKAKYTICGEELRVQNRMFDTIQTKSAVFTLNTTKTVADEMPYCYECCIINNTKQTTYSGKIGHNPSTQFNPRGICQDHDGRIIVSDYWNHAIHQLTTEGEFRKILMREEDGLTHPTAVAIDNYSYLWIGQKDGTVHIIRHIP